MKDILFVFVLHEECTYTEIFLSPFPLYLDFILIFTLLITIFILNTEKYRPEALGILTLFAQYFFKINFKVPHCAT